MTSASVLEYCIGWTLFSFTRPLFDRHCYRCKTYSMISGCIYWQPVLVNILHVTSNLPRMIFLIDRFVCKVRLSVRLCCRAMHCVRTATVILRSVRWRRECAATSVLTRRVPTRLQWLEYRRVSNVTPALWCLTPCPHQSGASFAIGQLVQVLYYDVYFLTNNNACPLPFNGEMQSPSCARSLPPINHPLQSFLLPTGFVLVG